MGKYALSDVFNESQIPIVTFVPPKDFQDLVGSLLTPGKHVTLCGPSGCGKTTLARKALDKAKIEAGKFHWMSGRSYSEFTDWTEVFAKEFGCQNDKEEIVEWLKACGIIVVDDFHHLNHRVRDEISRLLKLWHELGIRVFIIGIAESSHRLLAIDPELGIRNDPYEMKTQNDEFISDVIRHGENALNINFEDSTRKSFITAAKGIPSAIQVICRIACQRKDIFETGDQHRNVAVQMDEIRDGVLRSYRGKYYNKVVGLAKGKQRARSVHNTYFQIIRHICLLDKSEIHVDELQKRIVAVEGNSAERARKNTSFYNCLLNLQDVIEQRGLSDALYYDATSKTISIEDPSFRLFLTLTDFDQLEQSVRVRKSRYAYDVALSFAGEHRDKAEQLREILNDKGYTVFYDFDQQHMLWGQNLRQKLQDVYTNEAEFMVVFLSNEYPEKDWPAFELEVGKAARAKRTSGYLLPLRVDDVHIVGLAHDVGYLDLQDMTLDKVAEILMKKIEDSEDTVGENNPARDENDAKSDGNEGSQK